MEWIRFGGIERYYGAQRVLGGATGVLRDAEKIGLVGPNGAGKSTLLRILAGLDAPDGGAVVRARGTRIGYVGQEASQHSHGSLREALEIAVAAVRAHERELRALEQAMSGENGDVALAHLLEKYARARDEFERHGGEGFERRMRSMIAAFGFATEDLDRSTEEFSGGQRTRAALARVLLEDPDVLLLDEPTNHLDIEATRWLEQLIARDRRAFVIISHDRYVLDHVATGIWDLERGEITAYTRGRDEGAYSAFVAERLRKDELAQAEYERYAAERVRRQAVIAELRTHGSHNYAQVRSREKQLAKFDAPDAPRRRAKKIAVKLASSSARRDGIDLAVDGLSKAYGAPLFAGLEFDLAHGERLAVVGPNGSGKSTLLKILAGLAPADSGDVNFRSGVKPSYFSQDSAAALDIGMRAVDAVGEEAGVLPQRARALLGAMGLGGDAADKKVESFSGGERRRIMLARLMARDADCLLLDEPTNDLDIASREALEHALDGYGGSIVVVSHDRYLLARIADRVLSLRDGEWTLGDGGYEAYESRRAAEAQASLATPAAEIVRDEPAPPVSQARLSKNRRVSLEQESARLEAEIVRLDARRADIEERFASPEISRDGKRVRSLRSELDEIDRAATAALAAWELAVEALDADDAAARASQ
ncbi:MAG TPA: ABC-F family ATP-binding cassette domain-containing protein [Candidatus Eremiobacteraceae bacterium]